MRITYFRGFDLLPNCPHLQRRNRAEEMRATGALSGGPAALEKKDVQVFANALDRILARSVNR